MTKKPSLSNQEVPKTKPQRFFLNAVPIDIIWGKNWRMYEIDVDGWNSEEDYDKILTFRHEIRPKDYIIENHGRILVIIPRNSSEITKEFENQIRTTLERVMNKTIRLNPRDIPTLLQDADPAMIEAIRKGIGELLTEKIELKGFSKIGSGGGIGSFLPPQNWLGSKFEKTIGDVKLFQTFKLSLVLNSIENKFYLAADIKGRFRSTQILDEWLTLSGNHHVSPEQWKKGDKAWRILEDPAMISIFQREIIEEVFEIRHLESYAETQSKNLGWGRYRTKTISELINEGLLLAQDESDFFVTLKPRGKIIKNPNVELLLPARYLYRHLSQPISQDQDFSEDFKRFTKIKPENRYQFITNFFQELSSTKIVTLPTLLEGDCIQYARPSIGKNIVQDFGRAPILSDWGVQEWGPLKRIPIFYYPIPRIKKIAESFARELEKFMRSVVEKTKQASADFSLDLIELPRGRADWGKIGQTIGDGTCPIIILGREGADYRLIKSKLTQELRIPVQILREDTVLQSRNLFALVRTVFPQILAKVGGLPYQLSPPILDRALLIGLDKARDSNESTPSASAGVAAVTPEGRYVSGASTPLERNTTDFINVDLLAPDLLRELEEQRFLSSYDYVVILRDGSPETCRREVDQWKRHLASYNMNFIFIASRKTHAFRIFPEDIERQIAENSRISFPVPLVLNGNPLPPADFLVVASKAPQGTPKPVLYTLMENTTPLSLKEIKEKVLSQITSLSMLCWESPMPTSQPLPLHYANKLAAFTQLVQQRWNSTNRLPMFI